MSRYQQATISIHVCVPRQRNYIMYIAIHYVDWSIYVKLLEVHIQSLLTKSSLTKTLHHIQGDIHLSKINTNTHTDEYMSRGRFGISNHKLRVSHVTIAGAIFLSNVTRELNIHNHFSCFPLQTNMCKNVCFIVTCESVCNNSAMRFGGTLRDICTVLS